MNSAMAAIVIATTRITMPASGFASAGIKHLLIRTTQPSRWITSHPWFTRSGRPVSFDSSTGADSQSTENSTMTDRQGRCVCGDVSYHLSDAPNKLDVCHCKTASASQAVPYAPSWPYRSTGWHSQESQNAFRDDDTVDGRTVERYFCDRCGSPIYVRVERAPNTAYVFTARWTICRSYSPNVTVGSLPNTTGWKSMIRKAVRYPALMPEQSA